MVGPGHDPLKPQQSMVFQGAILRFTGSAVSWNTLTPLSVVNGRSLTSGVITRTGVWAASVIALSGLSGRFIADNRIAPPRPASVATALCRNVRRDLMFFPRKELQ